jgi:hypothetical protein
LEIRNIFIVLLIGCSILSILSSLNFALLYAQNNSNIINSKTIGHDLNHVSKTVNNSNDTNNKYGVNIVSLPSSNFYDLDVKNKIFNVTLDVFSGRPNPILALTKEESIFFLNNISQIKPTTENLQNYPEKILGYRGFIVDEKGDKDLPLKRFEIYNGAIKVFSNNSSYILKDKDFQIENRLLQTAYNHIDNDTLNFVKEDIANRK